MRKVFALFLTAMFVFSFAATGRPRMHPHSHIEKVESLWPITQPWSWELEQKYAQWVRNTLEPDFYVHYNIKTVCSDVVLSMRWIFARENGLPVANHVYLDGVYKISARLFTNTSVHPEWRKLKTAPEWYNDERFLAALRYLFAHTDVFSLWRDSYPIAINMDSFIPGAYHINLSKTGGHSMMIWQVNHGPDQIPVLTLSSTTPRAVRTLNQYMYVETEPDPKHLGLFRMLWPVADQHGHVALAAPETMPYYSLEQFAPDFVRAPAQKFWEEVFDRVDPQWDLHRVVSTLLEQISKMFVSRAAIVDQAYAYCSQRPEGCREGTQDWEDWSTPDRDARLLANINVFGQLDYQLGRPADLNPALDTVVVNDQGLRLTVRQGIENWLAGKYNSDPNMSITARWGWTDELPHAQDLEQ